MGRHLQRSSGVGLQNSSEPAKSWPPLTGWVGPFQEDCSWVPYMRTIERGVHCASQNRIVTEQGSFSVAAKEVCARKLCRLRPEIGLARTESGGLLHRESAVLEGVLECES